MNDSPVFSNLKGGVYHTFGAKGPLNWVCLKNCRKLATNCTPSRAFATAKLEREPPNHFCSCPPHSGMPPNQPWHLQQWNASLPLGSRGPPPKIQNWGHCSPVSNAPAAPAFLRTPNSSATMFPHHWAFQPHQPCQWQQCCPLCPSCC